MNFWQKKTSIKDEHGKLLRMRFTNHARSRMDELQMSHKKAIWLLANAWEEKPDKAIRKYKAKMYGSQQASFVYYRNGSVLFTLCHYGDFVSVITVTDQLATVPYYYVPRNFAQHLLPQPIPVVA